MNDSVAAAVLVGLVLGQVAASWHRNWTGLAYYLCSASLYYFSIWYGVTWDAERICGAIALIGFVVRTDPSSQRPGFWATRVSLLWLYGVINTALASRTWPTDSIHGATIFYGDLRWVVGVINWTLWCGLAWYVMCVTRKQHNFAKIRSVVVIFGCCMAAYACYQMVAQFAGLPYTGIRRHYSRSIAGSTSEEGAFIGTTKGDIPRANAFSGEPKTLGVITVFWISLAASTLVERRRSVRSTLPRLLLLSLALILTFSTAAWVGLGCASVVFAIGLRGSPEGRVYLRFASVILIGVTAGIGVAYLTGDVTFAREVAVARTAGRFDREWLEVADREAFGLMLEEPRVFVFGTGVSGAAFYVADRAGLGSNMVYSPSIGFIAFVSEHGILGLLLYAWVCWPGIRRWLSIRRANDVRSAVMLSVGLAGVIQGLIFGPFWLNGCSLGLLLSNPCSSRTQEPARRPIEQFRHVSARK